MASKRSVTKDFFKLMKSIDSFTDGQARVLSWEGGSENYSSITHFSFIVEISPSDGPYASGKFKFEIQTNNEWPYEAPTVTCLTEIYHPNIDDIQCEPGRSADDHLNLGVCVSLLDEDQWTSSMSFEDCVQALLFLFYEPNFDDPLASSCYSDNFEEDVLISLKGGMIRESIFYNTNYGWLEKYGKESNNNDRSANFSSEKENDKNERVSSVNLKRDVKQSNQSILDEFCSSYLHELVYEDPGFHTFDFYQ